MIKGYIAHTDNGDERYVTINANVLSPEESQKVINHSPTGFSWGYGGSGPAQLSLAILLRFCRKDEAIRLHQPFKWDIISKLPIDEEWEIPNQRVHDWIEAMREKSVTN